MASPYEWVDPFAEIERQQRLAASAHEGGRRAVLAPLQEAMRRGFPAKIEAATQELAMGVARHMAREVAAKTSYDYFTSRVVPEVAEAFRRGCEEVIGVTLSPQTARVGVNLATFADRDEAMMAISYEIVQPIRLHIRTAL